MALRLGTQRRIASGYITASPGPGAFRGESLQEIRNHIPGSSSSLRIADGVVMPRGTMSGNQLGVTVIRTEMHSNDASPIHAFYHRHSESSFSSPYEEPRRANSQKKAPWTACDRL